MTRAETRMARLQWLDSYWRDNGEGPKRIEMAHAWGVHPNGHLDAILATLVRHGLVAREWGEPRSTRVTVKGRRKLLRASRRAA